MRRYCASDQVVTIDGSMKTSPPRGAMFSLMRMITMKHSAKNQAKGQFHEAKGKVKEMAGKLIDDPELEGEGKGERIAGKVQKKIGQVEQVVGR
jgi:uncharacterized protein YjbJ (UPF0337 family)